jgi:hypothetical protein
MQVEIRTIKKLLIDMSKYLDFKNMIRYSPTTLVNDIVGTVLVMLFNNYTII